MYDFWRYSTLGVGIVFAFKKWLYLIWYALHIVSYNVTYTT